MAKRIILNMGHRDLTGGGTAGGGLTERGETDDVVLAIHRALEAVGVEAYINQELDGDSDPTMLNKNLDWVGRNAVDIDRRYGPVDAYLSIHLEGSGQPGLFAIVPDAAGLIAYATQAPDPGDTWADNPKDVAFARALAKHCSATTGLGKRATTEQGVMSERATGVGGQGWRLSEFHETMPIRSHATRNILECGAMPNSNDIRIISAPGFPDKIAQGVVAAFAEVFGLPDGADVPAPPKEEPPVADSKYPDGMDEGIAALLFGKVTAGKTVYQFDPKGPVSKAWLLRGRETGLWPELVKVQSYKDSTSVTRTYFIFAGGFVLWQPNKGQAVRGLK